MEINVSQLAATLNRALAPVYMLSGEEPLQIQQSLNLVYKSAHEGGYTERQVLHVERSFDWSQVSQQSNNMSLFGDKKVLELRLPTGKPGTAGAKALLDYCQQPPEDVLLIINSGKLDKAALNAKWVQAINEIGTHVRIWPLSGADLITWIQQRLEKEKLNHDRANAEYIASRVEGNMLAAAQEIEKMALLSIDSKQPTEAWLADQSKFSVFDLVDNILSGQRPQVIKILAHLQRESFAPNLVLWGLAELLRAVLYVGRPAGSKGVQNAFIYNKRHQLNQHVRKFTPQQLHTLLAKCGQIDRMIKGRASGDVWQSFADVSLKLTR